jgi:3D (Asp-Asp-Asp) domain-containing protein
MKPYLENVWTMSAAKTREAAVEAWVAVESSPLSFLRRPSLWLLLFGLFMAPLSPWHSPLEALPALEVAAPMLFGPDPEPQPLGSILSARLAAIVRPSPEPILDGLPVTITAYTSEVRWTDEEPFVTATGRWVGPGIVALSRDLIRTYTPGAPFDYGDRVWIPGLGEFQVEDTLNRRYTQRVDIWVNSGRTARHMGIRRGRLYGMALPGAPEIGLLAETRTGTQPPWEGLSRIAVP